MPPALTYALLAACGALFIATIWFDRRPASSRFAHLKRFTIVVQIAAVVAAYFVVRPGRGVDGRAAIATSMAAGKPLLLDMYSNF